MRLYMHRGHVWKMQAQTACMIMLLEGFAAATPTINIPLNSQFPPVARVSEPFSFTLSKSTFSSDEIFTYALSNAPSWLSLNSATRTLSGTPPDWASGTAPTLDIVATDGSGSISMRSKLVVSAHAAPEVAIPIETQLQSLTSNSANNSITFKSSTQFSFSFNKDTFTYNENPSSLDISAVTMDNTPLPPWIFFDKSIMTFSGKTPDPKVLATPQERFGIRLIASEMSGFAGISIPLYIEVENHKLAWDDTVLEMKTFMEKPFESNILAETLKLDGKVANKSDIISVTTTGSPSWLEFDNTTYVLYGVPQEPGESASPLDVTVSAQDIYGGTAIIVIRVTLARNIFFDGSIAPVNATIGQTFSYNVSQTLVDASAVDIAVSVSPAASWLSFDSKTLALSGDVSKSAEESPINITMAATPKLALSKTTPDLKSFTINVISRPLNSDGLEASGGPTASVSKHGLNRGELTAVILLSILAVIVIAGVLFCYGRRRNRNKFPGPRVSQSKRDISRPSLQKKFSILGLNGGRVSIHPGLSPKAKYLDKFTFSNPNPFSAKHYDTTIRQSVSSSRYSNRLSSHFDVGSCGRKDFCRPFQVTTKPGNSIEDDPNVIIIQNFPSESDEETKSHGVTGAPSAVRTKGGAYSFHPYRTTPRASNLQQTPESSYTANMQSYRAHKRHQTPSNLGPLPIIPSKLHSSPGLQRTGSAVSRRNTNRTTGSWSAYGYNQGSSVTPIEDSAWGSIPSSPIKSSSARPRSSLSAVTESTDVLYLGQPSPMTTGDDSPRLKSNSVSPPLQTFLDMAYSPSDANTRNTSPSVSRLPSRRGMGSSPFFSGSHRAISRVQPRSKKPSGECGEVETRNCRRQEVPEPLTLRKLTREDNSLEALEDPGMVPLLDGLGSSRNGSVVVSSYTGSIEMTEDGTKRLLSFLASVDKRRSWMSDEGSRKSFSAWDFEQDDDSVAEVGNAALQRFKSYKSNVSSRSKATFRGHSIWLGSENQDAPGPTFMEQMAALEFCGGMLERNSNKGNRWSRNQWSDSRANSSGRLSAPVSPRSFELGPWVKKDGDNRVDSVIV